MKNKEEYDAFYVITIQKMRSVKPGITKSEAWDRIKKWTDSGCDVNQDAPDVRKALLVYTRRKFNHAWKKTVDVRN